MADWTDEDGNSLGEWVPITEDEFDSLRGRLLDTATVFAARTEMGDGTYPEPPRNQHIYTEWGRKGDETPLISCRDVYDYFGAREHTHAKFVLASLATEETEK